MTWPFSAEHFDRRVVEEECDAVAFREIVFESVGRHVALAAAINDHDFVGAESARLGGGVDRGVAATDHRDARADRNLGAAVRYGFAR